MVDDVDKNPFNVGSFQHREFYGQGDFENLTAGMKSLKMVDLFLEQTFRSPLSPTLPPMLPHHQNLFG